MIRKPNRHASAIRPGNLRELGAGVLRSPVARTALLLGILIHFVGFFAFSVVAPPSDAPPFPLPYLVLLDQAHKVRAEPGAIFGTDLMDTAPLFLPTRWNAGLRGRALLTDEAPDLLFDAFPPDIELWRIPVNEHVRQVIGLPDSAADVLVFDGKRLFTTFGQLEPPAATRPQPEFAATLKVINLESGQLVRVERFSAAEIEVAMPFGPSEFLLRVHPTGRIGDPLSVSGQSGQELRDVISRIVRERQLEHILHAGYYRLVFGP